MGKSFYCINVLTKENWWIPICGSEFECATKEGVNDLIKTAMSYCMSHDHKDFAIVEEVFEGEGFLGSRNEFVFSKDKDSLPMDHATWIFTAWWQKWELR